MKPLDIFYIATLCAFFLVAVLSIGPREDSFVYDLTDEMDPAGYRFVLEGECTCEEPLIRSESGQAVCPAAATVCEIDFADSRGRRRVDLGAQPVLLDYIYQLPNSERSDGLDGLDDEPVPSESLGERGRLSEPLAQTSWLDELVIAMSDAMPDSIAVKLDGPSREPGFREPEAAARNARES